MSGKAKISMAKITEAKTFLQQLPAKKMSKTQEEALEFLKKEVHAAAKKGYDAKEIRDLLSAKGVKISAMLLKTFLDESPDRKTENISDANRGKLPDAPEENH